MKENKDNGKKLNERLWEMQSVLQRATAGDYTARCSVSMAGVSGRDPLSTVAPAINMLIAEVENRGIEINERERELEESVKRLAEQQGEIDAKLKMIDRQRDAIRELSTPVLELWEGVLVLPVIGVMDTKRAADLMESLLNAVATSQSQFVILDITGVDVVDTRTADHFIKVVRAAELLGSKCILTGVQPAVAQTLVELSLDLSEITTLGNLREGLKACLAQIEGASKAS